MDSLTASDVPAAARLVGDGRAALGDDAASLLADHGIESGVVVDVGTGDEPPRIEISAERRGEMASLHAAGKHDGTGIGLALCERVAERHGGEMWVESDPGDGATFSFTVPVEGVRNG